MYGDKRDYKKIDIFISGVYVCSTNWAKNCKQAKEKYLEKHSEVRPENVKAYFAK